MNTFMWFICGKVRVPFSYEHQSNVTTYLDITQHTGTSSKAMKEQANLLLDYYNY